MNVAPGLAAGVRGTLDRSLVALQTRPMLPPITPSSPSPARATVAALHDDGTVDVHYSDGDKEQRVPRRRIRVFVCADAAERAAGREANRQKTEAKRAAKAAEREAARATVVEAAAAGRADRAAEKAAAKAAVRDAAFEAVVAARTYKWQWCALHTLLPGGRRAAEGEQVQGKYQGADGGKNWFAGVVTAVGGPPPARAEI